MTSGPIQALAPGLLSLLGLKNAGNLPDQFGGQVDPTLEILPFYLAAQREVLTLQWAIALNQAPAGLAPGSLRVPQNEVWYLHSFTMFSGALLTAEAIKMQCLIANDALITTTSHAGPTVEVSGAGFTNGVAACTTAIGNIWMPPDSGLAATIRGYQGAARNINLEAVISRFRV